MRKYYPNKRQLYVAGNSNRFIYGFGLSLSSTPNTLKIKNTKYTECILCFFIIYL